jgi:hypothetical protein
MKAALAVLVGIVILAAAFGLYRWRAGGDAQQERAEAAAAEFAAYFGRAAQTSCKVSELVQLPNGLWRFRLDCGQGSRCMALDLDRFRATTRDSIYVGGTVEGVADAPCAPNLWLAQDAARRLEASAWARGRNARFFSCAGRREQRYEMFTDRFGCRYSARGGDGYVVIQTTGPDTFEIVGR